MRRNPRDYDWCIKSATGWINGKPSIERIIKENNHEGTIMVVRRLDEAYNAKEVPIFVLGAGGNYGVIGEKVSFLQDTGNGYGKCGDCIIENIITISKDSIDDPGNEIGLREKRPLWVFK